MNIGIDKLKEIGELLEVMKGYSWLIYPVFEGPVSAEHFKFYDTREQANQSREKNEEVVYANGFRDVFQRIFDENSQQYGIEHRPLIISIDTHQIFTDNMHAIETREKAEMLNDQLSRWGIEDNMTEYLEVFIADSREPFCIETTNLLKKDKETFTLNIDTDTNGCCFIESFVYESKKDISVIDTTVENVNSIALDKIMWKVPWENIERRAFLRLPTEDTAFLHSLMRDIETAMDTLSKTKEGQEAVEQLKAKYWLGTATGENYPEIDDSKSKYQIVHEFIRNGDHLYSRNEASNLMQGRHVSHDITENGSQIQPWFKYEKKDDDAYGEIVGIALSENIDLEKQIIEASKKGFSFSEGIEDLVKNLRSGNEISSQFSTGIVEYNCKLSLNAATGEFEVRLLNSKRLQSCVIKDDISKGRKL